MGSGRYPPIESMGHGWILIFTAEKLSVDCTEDGLILVLIDLHSSFWNWTLVTCFDIMNMVSLLPGSLGLVYILICCLAIIHFFSLNYFFAQLPKSFDIFFTLVCIFLFENVVYVTYKK